MESQAPSIPVHLVGKSLHRMATGGPCLPFSASWRLIASLERHSNAVCFSCSFPLDRLPQLSGSGCYVSTAAHRGMGGAALQSPVIPPAGPARTGRLDRQTQKNMPNMPKKCKKLGKYILAKPC